LITFGLWVVVSGEAWQAVRWLGRLVDALLFKSGFGDEGCMIGHLDV